MNLKLRPRMSLDSDIPVTIRLAELRQEHERLRRAKQLREAYGINFYRPHAKQDKFHAAGHIQGRHGRSGNRGGKTKCGAAEDAAWLIGGRTWYKESFDVVDGKKNVVRRHVGAQNHPLITNGIPPYPVKGLLICQDWPKSKEIFTNREGSYETWGDIFQLLPFDSIGRVHMNRGYVDQVNVKRLTEYGGGESTFYVDTVESYKHARQSAESSDFDFIHLDEPCPKPMFEAHRRGLMDRRGKFWINCTPLEEPWISDEFVPPKKFVIQDAPEGLQFNRLEGLASRFLITWSAYDNPWLSEEAIAEFTAGLNREERECRIFGRPLSYAGMVYPEFIYDLHVLCDPPNGWEAFHIPPKNYTIRLWFDYHTRLPQAILFFATDPKGRVFVYDELFDDTLIDPVAKSILRKTSGYFVADREIDPFAIIPNPVTDESILDELCKYELFFEPATKDLSRGVKAVRARLAERDPQGLPTIFFSPNLQQTLYEFTHYVYDLKKNEPKDENNHMMENLYRAVLNGLSYIEPPKDEAFVRKIYTVPLDQNLRDFQPASLK
jgi:hypothetical protein